MEVVRRSRRLAGKSAQTPAPLLNRHKRKRSLEQSVAEPSVIKRAKTMIEQDHKDMIRYFHTHNCQWCEGDVQCLGRHQEDGLFVLRRPPFVTLDQGGRPQEVLAYSSQVCPFVESLHMACPYGYKCKYAHTQEEIDYHPWNYKTRMCPSNAVVTDETECGHGWQCPHAHGEDEKRQGIDQAFIDLWWRAQ